MQPSLRRLESLELLSFAALGGPAVIGDVSAELDRRAAAALVRRILKRPEVRDRRPAARRCERVAAVA
ncbi:MAG: hypothetical protein NT049_01150 [Planctomycetota bacterium]|nr:hypothetical protein [Planctomycetota bacterium]